MQVKIADFGLATQLSRPDEKHLTMCGTPNYISPEVASRSSHGLEVDVWGLGCMLYTLLVGRPPFDTNEVKSTLTRVVMAKYELPAYLSPEAKDLIESLLKKNPKERIHLGQILEHPFIKEHNPSPNAIQSKLSVQDSGVHTMSSKRDSLRTSVNSDVKYNYRSRSEERKNNLEQYNNRPPSIQNQYSDKRYGSMDENLNPARIGQSYEETKAPKPEEISLFSHPRSNHSIHDVCGSVNVKRCQHSRCSQNCCHAPDPGGGGFVPTSNNVLTDLKTKENFSDEYFEPVLIPEPKKIDIPKLCSFRLLPTRHQTKNAVLSVLESGEVCIEFIKKRGRSKQDMVVEVCLISPDGLRIVLYNPEGGKGCAPADVPPALPKQGADAIYSYENLPEKHWKKYSYAGKFVELVRAKTPKITYYSDKAKCVLMENLTDFESCFYDGSKVTKSYTEGIKIIELDGHSVSLSSEEQITTLRSAYQLLWKQTQQFLEHCLLIERTLDALPGTTFPIIIGRRPINVSQGKENIQTTPQMPSFNLSTTSTSTQRSSRPVRGISPRRVTVPGVGTALQLSCGEVRVRYPDGSQLSVQPKGNVRYEWQSGHQCHYGPTDLIPPEVRDKLTEMPKIVKYLARPSPTSSEGGQFRHRPVR